MDKVWAFVRENFLGDKMIWFVVLLLFSISMLVVYSSASSLAFRSEGGTTSWYLYKQIGISVLGILIMIIVHHLPYRFFSRISQILWVVSLLALIYTLKWGTEINSAKRWITLPVLNITFQTSDMAKLALIMYLARQLSVSQEKINSFRQALVPLVIPILLTCALIAPENLSTACILFLTSVIVMFLGRVPLTHISGVCGMGGLLVGLLILMLLFLPEDMLVRRMVTWKHRIEDFMQGVQDPNDDYQVIQAKIAIVNGGFVSLNPGGSKQKNFVPHPYSDEIFATIIEEYGILGGIIVLGIYLFFLARCIFLLIRSPNAFGALLALGLGTSLVIQALVNMSVAVNLVPVTGVTLPLVSMGGSSVFFTSIAFGIILSVSRSIDQEEKIQEN